jgi:hypothetical protein
MTLEQLLSPAVWEWSQANKHLPEEQLLNEFNKWIVDNENQINESVKNNFDEINEYIEKGKENARLLMESTDEIDFDSMDFDDIDDSPETPDKPISGEVESESDEKTVDDVEETIAGKIILSNSTKHPQTNVYNAINSLYAFLEKKKITHEENTAYWSQFDMAKVTNTTALLAFTDIPRANLKHWNMSKVQHMEGMFYKSTFNNDSICGWDVSSCADFLRMFTFSDFNQSLKKWTPAYVEKTELDDYGNPVLDSDGKEKKIRTRANLPLIGAAADEEAEMIKNYWFEKFESMPVKESKEEKSMKNIVDFETFINEGFGDFVKKGFDKIKSFFKNMVIKINNFVAMFDSKGEIIDASSPYTALNYISDGKVKGVTAFTGVKNEYLNDNVKAVASIVESPEYYGIIDKNSIEYRNYLTMVDMVNEHYNKYGEKLNEASSRVGFSSESGGLKDCRDINSKDLKFLLNQAIKNVPAYKDDNYGGAVLIWGAPGIGKSTIPKAIIKEWNDNHDVNNQKAVMVVECGNLTTDGFSLPLPMPKKMGEYLEEHPKVASKLRAKGYDIDKESFLKNEIKVSGEALKSWLPCYKESIDQEENDIRNDIANGRLIKKRSGGRLKVTETTEGGILLFDEFFRANESIFKILMQIILTRTFNDEYILGDKWAIIGCSNRPKDDEEVDSTFSNTGAVLGTRFGGGQYNFIPDFDDWKKWAVKEGHFDDATITFLMQAKDPTSGEYTNWHTIRPDEYTAGKTSWPTPRTWSMLMTELYNIMENEGYSSIQEIPSDIIKLKADGTIGKEMADNYIQFLSTFQTSFSPKEVLKNPKYDIPTDMKCSEVIDRLKKYIDLTFDKDNLPTEEQMMNIFNTLERTFNASKDNYVRPLYVSLFNKFGFLESKEYRDVMVKTFPNFIKAFMKKYGLTSPAALKDFLI